MVEKSFVEGDVDDIPSDVEVEEQDVNEGQFISSILTHHAGILLSHPGVGYLYPPSAHIVLAQCYPTP